MGDSQQAVVARCASTTRGASTASSSRRPRSGRSRAGGLGFWLVTALVGSTSCGSVRAQQEDYDYGGGYQPQGPPMRTG